MGVHEAHLVDEAAGDARHHVLDVGADGADAGELFTGGPPEFHAEVLGVELADVHVDVFEGLGEGAAGAFDGDHPAGDVDFDAVGNGEALGGEFGLHGEGVLEEVKIEWRAELNQSSQVRLRGSETTEPHDFGLFNFIPILVLLVSVEEMLQPGDESLQSLGSLGHPVGRHETIE